MSLARIQPLPPDAVIFDMDGVLADTREFHLRAFQELGADHGVPMTAEQFQGMFGLENSVFLPRMFGRVMEVEESRRLADWKEARYRELITGQITLLAGARELIGWFRSKGLPLAVASSAPRANIEQILRTTGVEQDFVAILAAEDVTKHKPEPDVFLLAAKRMGMRSERSWVIEDSLHGIEAAKAAGSRAIAVATTHPAEDLGPADAVFEDMTHLYRELVSWDSSSNVQNR